MSHIIIHENTRTFHLQNETFSYVITVLPNGHLGQLYFGKRITDRGDYSHLFTPVWRAMCSYVEEGSPVCLEQTKQEYPVYGTGDYRTPAISVRQENGSRISNFVYEGYKVISGKPALAGLPAVYTEDDREAETLILTVKDALTGVKAELMYTIFSDAGILTRSARIINEGEKTVHLESAMSLCLDLPDHDYEWLQFSGAWARERHLKVRRLEMGITSVGSMRGNSSANHNPFVILKRPTADEGQGEAIGFSLVYSGNFLAQAEVDTFDNTRVLMGIHPDTFAWRLEPGADFQTPEVVMVYTRQGLNALSQTYQRLYQSRLVRGQWRRKARPILLNNWEATYFDFNEEKLLAIAAKAKACGVELFVLDDGWFGQRTNDRAGLGDWFVNKDRLPNGIAGLSEKVEALGLKFGLWFEPEMINMDSDLYRNHPDYMLCTPGRTPAQGRHQYVLDFSRKDVVDAIYDMMAKLFREARISYVKWDMNRSMTDVYSAVLPADRQGEVFHRYILGVYDLYERLTAEFPHILFESCASGGCRFDPGMLYYAPQAWSSDDSDAIERLKIQYGSSYCYPVSSFGAHVSVVPNHQVNRVTPLSTRANVAYFGTFGYELDLNRLSEQEQAMVKQQIAFMKEHRQLLQFGTFYRLSSPFEGNETAWMVVSEDKSKAIVGWYRVLNTPNPSVKYLKLAGLVETAEYTVTEPFKTEDSTRQAYGDELMNIGLLTNENLWNDAPQIESAGDFYSRIFVLKKK